jgi:hypothetical protein
LIGYTKKELPQHGEGEGIFNFTGAIIFYGELIHKLSCMVQWFR